MPGDKSYLNQQMKEAMVGLSSTDVMGIMRKCETLDEWNEKCDEIKKKFGGDFPSFWYAAIVESGIQASQLAKFEKK